VTKACAPHLALIRESLAAIERYRPADRETFLANPMAQDAIVMRLQVIGEHLERMRAVDAPAFARQAPDSWHKLIWLRYIVAHGGQTVEMERVWQVVTDELPAFAASIEAAAAE
jgi:uncharacterized protein with HEPN domain